MRNKFYVAAASWSPSPEPDYRVCPCCYCRWPIGRLVGFIVLLILIIIARERSGGEASSSSSSIIDCWYVVVACSCWVVLGMEKSIHLSTSTLDPSPPPSRRPISPAERSIWIKQSPPPARSHLFQVVVAVIVIVTRCATIAILSLRPFTSFRSINEWLGNWILNGWTDEDWIVCDILWYYDILPTLHIYSISICYTCSAAAIASAPVFADYLVGVGIGDVQAVGVCILFCLPVSSALLCNCVIKC